MRLKVLGCSGAELPGHNPTSFLVNQTVAIDAGSITSILTEKQQWRIEKIFITHAHLDHIKGIPFLADNIIMKKPDHKVEVLSIRPVIQALKDNLLNSSIWPDFTVIPHPNDGMIKLSFIKEGTPVPVGDLTITAIKVNHSVPAVGYLVESSEARTLFFTGDTGPTDHTWKMLRGKKINALIIEVSFPNNMKEMALLTGHLTAELMSIELKKMAPPPERIYVTHPKPQLLSKIKRELAGLRMKNLSMLKEGQTINV